jgi:hypothetical protein
MEVIGMLLKQLGSFRCMVKVRQNLYEIHIIPHLYSLSLDALLHIYHATSERLWKCICRVSLNHEFPSLVKEKSNIGVDERRTFCIFYS